MKINVGIFFGGCSNEREFSLASARTVYNNLNQLIFNPVPVFVDGFGRWVLLNQALIHKEGIRDFFPPSDALPYSENNFKIYAESLSNSEGDFDERLLHQIGQPIEQSVLSEHIDIAFLTFKKAVVQLKETLQELNIPFSGNSSAINHLMADKSLLCDEIQKHGLSSVPLRSISRQFWLGSNVYDFYQDISSTVGFPLLIRSVDQLDYILIDEQAGLEGFEQAVNRAFCREYIPLDEWHDRSSFERIDYVRFLGDIQDGLHYPIKASLGGVSKEVFHPEELLDWLNTATETAEHLSQVFVLEGAQATSTVTFERQLEGEEFSCMLIQAEDGSSIAFPPVTKNSLNKYGSQLSTKTLDLSDKELELIRRVGETLFSRLGLKTYAQLTGYYLEDGTVSMSIIDEMPPLLDNSFVVSQVALLGLNISQFITYILRISLSERLKESPSQVGFRGLLDRLDKAILSQHSLGESQKQIGVILGGNGAGRRASLKTGQFVYEQLSCSAIYNPKPIFLTYSGEQEELYELPLSLLLNTDVDDVLVQIKNWKTPTIVSKLRQECAELIGKYTWLSIAYKPRLINYDQLAETVDGVFIALHGRPGEDGQIQMQLEARRLAYNGSGVKSSSTAIDKYRTAQLLKKHNLEVAKQLLLSKQDYNIDKESFCRRIEQQLNYPVIAKPVDGVACSAVKKIENREELMAYTALVFQSASEQVDANRRVLKLKREEEIYYKSEILFEQFISKESAQYFLEVKGGLLAKSSSQAKMKFEAFVLSEVETDERKQLGAQSRLITPAQLGADVGNYDLILEQIQYSIERAARLLDIDGYCTIDAFVRVFPENVVETIIIEANLLPKLTKQSAIIQQAIIAGYQPIDFIHKVLSLGFERAQKKYGDYKVIPLEEKPAVEQSQAVQVVQKQALFTEKNTDQPLMENTPTAQDQPSKSTFKTKLVGLKNLLISPYFLKNIGAMLGTVALVFLLLNLFLNLYTSHGNSVQVENYTGLTIEDATKKAETRGFKISVNEAPFSLDIPTGEVIDQEPAALNRIKKNRTIYLTIIGEPKPRTIPSFSDAADDYKQYAPKLKSLQIETVVKEEIFDAKLAKGTILHFYYRGKKYTPNDVKRGVQIQQGSTLEFVITKNQDDNVRLPALKCKRYSEVGFLLPSLELKVGKIHGDVVDRADAFIWKQEPAYSAGAKILRGSSIDLYLQKERPQGCPAEIEINEPESDSGGLSNEEDSAPAPIERDTTGM